jgi:hypothetical protein
MLEQHLSEDRTCLIGYECSESHTVKIVTQEKLWQAHKNIYAPMIYMARA